MNNNSGTNGTSAPAAAAGYKIVAPSATPEGTDR
jgi:hypothetical protein